jgi:hypothetical protein
MWEFSATLWLVELAVERKRYWENVKYHFGIFSGDPIILRAAIVYEKWRRDGVGASKAPGPRSCRVLLNKPTAGRNI